MYPWNAVSILFTTYTYVLYFVITLIGAYHYYGYLRDRKRSSGSSLHLLLYLLILLLLYLIPLTITSIPLIVVLSFIQEYKLLTAFFYAPLIPLMLKYARYGCKREEKAKIDDIEYIVCYNDVVNAWFNRKTGKFYISDKLRRALTDLETKAIILHEEGHSKNRLLGSITTIISTVWYMAVATLILFLAALLKYGINTVITLELIAFFLPIVPLITVVTMLWSWTNEHESDLNALKNVSYEVVASALIKAHANEILKYVEKIELDQRSISEDVAVRFSDVLKTLLKYSWDAPLWFSELIKRPMYETHPPLKFRLVKLKNTCV